MNCQLLAALIGRYLPSSYTQVVEATHPESSQSLTYLIGQVAISKLDDRRPDEDRFDGESFP
ncbi:hypothetical protein [Lyngbya sp. PCC 8106]|uniref:hypothetical protein n=1 Tax=Lyngbya sp. (strain PCC 8106) TaxID=313612 RepID=UPI0000EA9F15|nr:hypothetical protein [Lyngbya sp. PCC 8106]EAW38890.1 hypothetical protein L8106_01207 [Lyngbya sp. PCC 8106]